jgi:hypothetical protein
MLELKPVELSDKYCKKWNEYSNDFQHLYKDGVKLRDRLYRVGGFGAKIKDNYFLLLGYYEAHYGDNITKVKKRKPHLEGRWTIINKNGDELVIFNHFDSPYLIGGVLYTLDNKYYNIETSECYGSSYTSIKSPNYVFLNTEHHDDISKRGVMKINKNDGTWELFQ